LCNWVLIFSFHSALEDCCCCCQILPSSTISWSKFSIACQSTCQFIPWCNQHPHKTLTNSCSVKHIKIKVYEFPTTKLISRIKSMLISCPDASSSWKFQPVQTMSWGNEPISHTSTSLCNSYVRIWVREKMCRQTWKLF
jgi:hypothetical protein